MNIQLRRVVPLVIPQTMLSARLAVFCEATGFKIVEAGESRWLLERGVHGWRSLFMTHLGYLYTRASVVVDFTERKITCSLSCRHWLWFERPGPIDNDRENLNAALDILANCLSADKPALVTLLWDPP